jgi:hypothetical protein
MANNGQHHLDPARSVIDRLGGVDVVARVTGKDRSRVYRWMYPMDRGGTGGLIPQRVIPGLLKYAEKNHIRLKAADFFAA